MKNKEIFSQWLSFLKTLFMGEILNTKDILKQTIALKKALSTAKTDEDRVLAISDTVSKAMTQRYQRTINASEKLYKIRNFVMKQMVKSSDPSPTETEAEMILKRFNKLPSDKKPSA